MSFKSTVITLALLTVAALPCCAQGVLPQSFGQWAAPNAATQASAAQISQFAPDKAGILREYGISSAERRDFTQGNQSATVTLYRMVDPTAAYGVFTFLRDPQMTTALTAAPAAYTAASPNRVILVVGNLVLDVSGAAVATPAANSPAAASRAPAIPTRPSDMDLKALAMTVFAHADHRPFPLIPSYLPRAGLIPGSEHYVLGPQALSQVFPVSGAPADWIGFDKSAEAISARYHLAGRPKTEEASLIVILYPTQQIAADKYNALPKWLALNTDDTQANGRTRVFGSRTGALIALLAGVDSQPVATEFLKQIQYASDVTWNEPTHELTDPSIGTMVVGAFFGTGFIMVMAIAAGIGFGGVRLLVKLVLPGKVFDRNQELEILQLGLSSKPIRAGDLYSVK